MRSLASISSLLLCVALVVGLSSSLDDQGWPLVDGKRVFVFGVYCSAPLASDLLHIRSMGYNTVLSYGYGVGKSDADILTYLDNAERAQLQVFFALESLMSLNTTQRVQRTTHYVSKFKDHPALFGWYLNDELTPKYIPKLTAQQQLVRSLDPAHITYSVLSWEFNQLDPYLKTSDALGTDPYPVPKLPLEWVDLEASYTINATSSVGAGCLMVTQMHELAIYTGDPSDREPTFNEKRVMSWMALTTLTGSRGLFHYSYFDQKRIIGGKPASAHTIERRFVEMQLIASEIESYAPVLMAESGPTLSLSYRGSTQGFSRRYGGVLWCFILNRGNASLEVHWSMNNYGGDVYMSPLGVEIFEVK